MPQEAVEREITEEMHRQIVDLKADATLDDGEPKAKVDPERYVFAIVFCFDSATDGYR